MHPKRVRQRAVELYESGLSCRATARELRRELPTGVTPPTIARWAQSCGISRPVGERRTVELPRDAVRLYEAGLTLDEIARKYHMSATTVRQRLEEMGVKIRRRTLKVSALADKEWLEAEYWGNERSAKEIALELGCSVFTVHYHLRRRGIPRKRERRTKGAASQ